MVLYLVLTKKLNYPILFLSEYVYKNRQEYYKTLNETSKTGGYKDIICFILKAIETQAELTAKKIIAINSLIQKISMQVQDEKLVKCIFSNPFISIKFLSQNLNITRQTASKYIGSLQKL